MNASMLNQNSGEIDNAGAELQAAYRISQEWAADANYSFLHMENPVVAAPEHKLYAGVNFSKGRWNVSTGVQYIAGLYTSAALRSMSTSPCGTCVPPSVPPIGRTFGQEGKTCLHKAMESMPDTRCPVRRRRQEYI